MNICGKNVAARHTSVAASALDSIAPKPTRITVGGVNRPETARRQWDEAAEPTDCEGRGSSARKPVADGKRGVAHHKRGTKTYARQGRLVRQTYTMMLTTAATTSANSQVAGMFCTAAHASS